MYEFSEFYFPRQNVYQKKKLITTHEITCYNVEDYNVNQKMDCCHITPSNQPVADVAPKLCSVLCTNFWYAICCEVFVNVGPMRVTNTLNRSRSSHMITPFILVQVLSALR
jgi:hypothetical protein